MKSFMTVLALGAVITASSSLALADSISATGSDRYNNSTLEFVGPFTVTGANNASGMPGGMFAGFNSITFTSMPLVYTTPASGFPAGGIQIFSITNGTVTDKFFDTSDMPGIDGSSYLTPGPAGTVNLNITGDGYFTGGNISGDLASVFTLSSQGEPGPNGDLNLNHGVVTFSGTGFTTAASVTPEPNSLVLMGTGLLAAAGMLFMRRRNANELA